MAVYKFIKRLLGIELIDRWNHLYRPIKNIFFFFIEIMIEIIKLWKKNFVRIECGIIKITLIFGNDARMTEFIEI